MNFIENYRGGITMQTDYNKQAEDFLRKHDIEVKFERSEHQECPRWERIGEKKRCNHNCHGYLYWVKFNKFKLNENGYQIYPPLATFELKFWSSYHNKIKHISPIAYDVLACLTKNDPGHFEDFCSEFGYNSDSLKDLEIYKSVEINKTMLTKQQIETEVQKQLIERVQAELTPIDTKGAYDEMIDSCFPTVEIGRYKFDPSYAFKKLDPIAYKIDMANYVDSQDDFYEISGDYYHMDDVERIQKEIEEQIEAKQESI
jgi:hypothetical protein